MAHLPHPDRRFGLLSLVYEHPGAPLCCSPPDNSCINSSPPGVSSFHIARLSSCSSPNIPATLFPTRQLSPYLSSSRLSALFCAVEASEIPIDGDTLYTRFIHPRCRLDCRHRPKTVRRPKTTAMAATTLAIPQQVKGPISPEKALQIPIPT